jgi:lipoprotein
MKVINVKKASTALVLGSIISCLALSGCNMDNPKQNSEENIRTRTAILVENETAILIKLKDINALATDRYVRLDAASGATIIADQKSVQIITDENSYEKAEIIADIIVGENGQVIDYDDMQKTRKLN